MNSCNHDVPTFGCSSCIGTDREKFAEKAYSEWKKIFRLPNCFVCGEKMIHYGRNTYPGRVEAIVICPRYDGDGSLLCEDEDIIVRIA